MNAKLSFSKQHDLQGVYGALRDQTFFASVFAAAHCFYLVAQNGTPQAQYLT
jgi:hypothetical protein